MSDFGDFDPDDALDTEPADPEQVARIQHRFRLDEGLEDGYVWEELAIGERERLVRVIERLLALLRRQGSLP